MTESKWLRAIDPQPMLEFLADRASDRKLRLFALEQLSGMRADLFLCDPHRIIVTGPRRLRGRPLDSRDLRSGMALIAAALAANHQSRVYLYPRGDHPMFESTNGYERDIPGVSRYADGYLRDLDAFLRRTARHH